MAGGTDASEIDIPSFLQQAKEYEEVDDIRDSILKLIRVESMSHPFSVVRATQLLRWAATEEYRSILSGQYARRSDDEGVSSLNEDIASAARSYRDTANNSSDPLLKVFSEVGKGLSDTASKVWSKFNS